MDADEAHGAAYLKKVGPNLYRSTNGTYYLLVKRGGKQFRRSLRTTDAALAKRRLREFQDRVTKLSVEGDNRNLRFEDLANQWLDSRKAELKPSSFSRREVAVNGLLPYLGGHALRSIGQRHFDAWKAGRGAKISARSWNIEIETLKQILAYAKDDLRILIDNPADTLKRRKVKQSGMVIPTKEQFRVLVQELRGGHRSTGEAADFVEFLAYSGCRKEEAAEVRWNDINLDLETLLVTGGELGTKNHEARTIPLFQPLRRLVESIRARKLEGEGRVFEIRAARMQIHRACERLGLPRFGHHTMRHFFCSNAIEAGCDFKVIAEWLGHKDGGVLVAKTYGHLRNEHSSAMAKRITFDATSG